jgi:hypothetical protein
VKITRELGMKERPKKITKLKERKQQRGKRNYREETMKK